MVLVLDNYDSFTYNLVQYIGEFDPNIEVYRNDALSIEELLDKKPSHIVISPGPKTPKEAGVSVELLKNIDNIPTLGVCLGHQSLANAYGAEIIRAPYLMHGKTSIVSNNQSKLYTDLPKSFVVTRYHSLIVARNSLPECLEITAETKDGLIMGLGHKTKPIFGMQYHPEAIRTEHGKTLIQNFLKL